MSGEGPGLPQIVRPLFSPLGDPFLTRPYVKAFRGTKIMEREAKKEAFRKYLESSGVLDALTKALVALYEENNRPSSATEFIQQKLGGPSIAEYEKLRAEKSDLQIKYEQLLHAHRSTREELEELKRRGSRCCPQPRETHGEGTPLRSPRNPQVQETVRLLINSTPVGKVASNVGTLGKR